MHGFKSVMELVPNPTTPWVEFQMEISLRAGETRFGRSSGSEWAKKHGTRLVAGHARIHLNTTVPSRS